MPIYVASKHAVIGLTKAAALTYAKAGVGINAVCPGVIEETEMHNAAVGSNEQFRQTTLEMHLVGRFGKPAEVVSAVMWLCSEGAGSVTGHTLLVDGVSRHLEFDEHLTALPSRAPDPSTAWGRLEARLSSGCKMKTREAIRVSVGHGKPQKTST